MNSNGHGGVRAKAGRPKGSSNRDTRQRQRRIELVGNQIARELRQHGIEAFDGDAHGFLVTVYKDPRIPMPFRLDAAKACIPYEKPRLAAITHKNSEDLPPVVDRVEYVIIDP